MTANAGPDPERVVANVYALYREFGASLPEGSAPVLFGAMLRWQRRAGQKAAV
jgi:hypothetical protein